MVALEGGNLALFAALKIVVYDITNSAFIIHVIKAFRIRIPNRLSSILLAVNQNLELTCSAIVKPNFSSVRSK